MAPRADDTDRRRLTLSRRLSLALLACAVLLAVLLLTVIAPVIRGSLDRLSDVSLRESTSTLRELTQQQTEASGTVLTDLIRRTMTARQQALQDLPLEAFGADIESMRAAILQQDEERSARQRRNIEYLTAEMQRRADVTIQQRLGELGRQQQERADQVTAAIRLTHLLLVAATLVLLLVVLGFGLHRFVVRPTLRLRQATQRIAAGEPTVPVPPAGNDELGDLSRDFAAMVEQLRASRGELQRLADNLEVEVGKKTQHLEQALVDLRSSHQQLALAERLASLGTLAGGIAHEFHNVIGGMRGCAQDLLVDEQDPERRETLAVVTRAADRGSAIVHQLLRFARQPGELRREVKLVTIVDDALRLTEPAARRQAVQIERDLPLDVVIEADADGLHQVFVNLFVNALQAMPDGGTLRTTLAATADEVTLAVRDTGVGIKATDLPHIFEPFFTTRADAVEPRHRGSGLGLAVSHGIVAAHGGRIEVASKPGAGTTFTVHLPRTRPRTEAP